MFGLNDILEFDCINHRIVTAIYSINNWSMIIEVGGDLSLLNLWEVCFHSLRCFFQTMGCLNIGFSIFFLEI